MEFDNDIFKRLVLLDDGEEVDEDFYWGTYPVDEEFSQEEDLDAQWGLDNHTKFDGKGGLFRWEKDYTALCELLSRCDMSRDFYSAVEERIERIIRKQVELAWYYGNEMAENKELLLSRSGKKVIARLKDVEILTIPDGVTDIALDAFSGCENLREVYLPDSIENIGMGAFKNCKQLKTIRLPDGIDLIEWTVFENCYELEEVYLPEGIRVIDGRAFKNCENLKKIHLPNSIEHIEREAFSGCDNLVIPELPQKLLSIGDYAFNGCTIENCCLDERINCIGKGVFCKCNLPNGLRIENKKMQMQYPKYLETTSIEKYLFGKKKYWQEGQCPTMTIYKYSIFDLSQKMFFEGRNISYHILEEEIVEVDGFTMQGNAILSYTGEEEDVSLPENTTYIEVDAFTNATQIKKLHLPPKLFSVAKDAFKPLTNLAEIYVFGEYSQIFDGFSITEDTTPIMMFVRSGESSDWGYNIACENKEYFAEKIFRIFMDYYIDADGVFRKLDEDAKKIVLIDKGKVVGKRSFSKHDIRWSFKLPEGTLSIERAFMHADISEIELPNSLKTIGDYAFFGSRVKRIILSEGLETIGQSAFFRTRLQNITIPKSVTSIGDYAFIACGKLKSVTCHAESLEIGKEIFSYDRKLKIRCKEESDMISVVEEAEGKVGDVVIPKIRNFKE